jgi:threonine synthase
LGLVEDNQPAMYAAQAEGCSPVVKAIEQGMDLFRPQKPNTIAKSIAIGNPADGYYVIKVIRESAGWGASAEDPEIIDAIKLLARTEGIFTEPAGGTTLACAIKLIQSGRIPRDEPICVCITGNGLKTTEAMHGQFAELPVINAKLAEFDEVVKQSEEKTPAANTKPEAV